MKSVSILASLFICSIIFPCTACAQWVMYCTNCSTTFTQALQHATGLEQLKQVYTQVDEALKQTEQQISIVQNTLQQYQTMEKNTVNLPMQFRQKIMGTFNKLSSLTQQLNMYQGDASTLSQVFSKTYAGTGTIRSMVEGTHDNASSVASKYYDMRDVWSSEVDRSQQAAFQESGMQLNEIQQQSSDLESNLSDLLTTPDGQMKAIEAGNQISAMQLLEAQKLRTLLASSYQSTVAKTMKDEKKQQIDDELSKDAFKTDKIDNYTSKSDPF